MADYDPDGDAYHRMRDVWKQYDEPAEEDPGCCKELARLKEQRHDLKEQRRDTKALLSKHDKSLADIGFTRQRAKPSFLTPSARTFRRNEGALDDFELDDDPQWGGRRKKRTKKRPKRTRKIKKKKRPKRTKRTRKRRRRA
jgi:uncharacterized protein YjiS (DUF1127 family)